MRLRVLHTIVSLLIAILALGQPSLHDGFTVEWHITDYDLPLAVEFDDAGTMYVIEKGGKIWIFRDGKKIPGPAKFKL